MVLKIMRDVKRNWGERELDRQFVVSAQVLERLSGLEASALEDLGLQALRGRTAPNAVYAVVRMSAASDEGAAPA